MKEGLGTEPGSRYHYEWAMLRFENAWYVAGHVVVFFSYDPLLTNATRLLLVASRTRNTRL